MGARHTGVRWELSKSSNDINAVMEDGTSIYIATAWYHEEARFRDEAKTNALLMASSLELFEALTELINSVGVEDIRCLRGQEVISMIVGERIK